MKLSFSQKDSIYKIFKTIKKIPSYKKVYITIDEKHSLFEHKRWWKQIKDIIDNHDLDVTFVTSSHLVKTYFKEHQCKVQYTPKDLWTKWWLFFYNIFFSTKEFHTSLLLRKNYISYIIICSELFVLWAILYFFRWLISPNVTIHIEPAYSIENIVYTYYYYPYWQPWTGNQKNSISIPYHIKEIPFEKTMTLDVKNMKYIIENAEWTVKLFNTIREPFPLLSWTRLISENGMLYTTKREVTLPRWTEKKPWIAYVDVVALPYKEDWQEIGEKWNILKGTPLRIKELPQSYEENKIYARSNNTFVWWKTIASGTVLTQDIQDIENKILSSMENEKEDTLKSYIQNKDIYYLPLPESTSMHIQEFFTTSRVGDTTSFIEGKIASTIRFPYIKKNDLQNAIQTFVEQRENKNNKHIRYDTNSTTFYPTAKNIEDTYYFIPTKTNIILWYNFNKDINNILEEVQAKVVGKNKEQAKEILLSYPDIAKVDIAISPPRYDTLPTTYARIKFRLIKK